MLKSFHFLGIHIPSYAFMLVLGLTAFFILFLYFFKSLRKEDCVTFNRLLFVTCISIVCLGVSAFLFNSLFHSIEEKRIVLGGITWLGGFVGAIAAFLFMIHALVPKKRGYEAETLSVLMPGIALAHAFGRVGCFLGGCCYGKVSDSPLAVVYPSGSSAAKLYPNAEGTGSLAVLPIPLFEAGFELLLFFVLMLLAKKYSKYALSLYCGCYGTFRFIAEFFRGDSRGSVGGFLSPSQLLSIFLILFGVLLFLEMKGVALKKLHEKRMLAQRMSDALPITRLVTSRDAEILRDLHALFLDGVISEEEYEDKKQKILERM